MKFVVLLGRILYSIIFIISAIGHFSPQTIDYATATGVPFAMVLVPLWGLIALVGGISILIGYKARWGAWLLVIFLVPVTLIMHRFWGIDEPGVVSLQLVMFLKNVALLGAALLITYFGAGPLSIDKN